MDITRITRPQAAKVYSVALTAILLMTAFNILFVCMPYYWFKSDGLFTISSSRPDLWACRSMILLAIAIISITSVTECVWVCCTHYNIKRIKWLRFCTVYGCIMGVGASIGSFWVVPGKEGTSDAGVLGIIAVILFILTWLLVSMVTTCCYDWTRCLTSWQESRSYTAVGMVRYTRRNMKLLRNRIRQCMTRREGQGGVMSVSYQHVNVSPSSSVSCQETSTSTDQETIDSSHVSSDGEGHSSNVLSGPGVTGEGTQDEAARPSDTVITVEQHFISDTPCADETLATSSL